MRWRWLRIQCTPRGINLDAGRLGEVKYHYPVLVASAMSMTMKLVDACFFEMRIECAASEQIQPMHVTQIRNDVVVMAPCIAVRDGDAGAKEQCARAACVDAAILSVEPFKTDSKSLLCRRCRSCKVSPSEFATV